MHVTAASQLKRRTLAGLKRSNPDAADLTIEWAGRVRRIEYPTGYIGLEARGIMRASGYATASVTATCDLDGSSFMARTWSARDTLDLVRPMIEAR